MSRSCERVALNKIEIGQRRRPRLVRQRALRQPLRRAAEREQPCRSSRPPSASGRSILRSARRWPGHSGGTRPDRDSDDLAALRIMTRVRAGAAAGVDSGFAFQQLGVALEPLTPATKTVRDAIDAELARVARDGYAVDLAEFAAGAKAPRW